MNKRKKSLIGLKNKKIPHDPNEILAIVNEKDEVIGKATRKEIHENGTLHREVNIFILNSKNELLLQKRKDRAIWDFGTSGHFPYNQTYEEAAVREVFEELGIKIKKSELIFVAKEINHSTQIVNNRFAKIFLLKKDFNLNEFNIDKDEILEVKYFNENDLNELLKKETATTGVLAKVLKKYLLGKLDHY